MPTENMPRGVYSLTRTSPDIFRGLLEGAGTIAEACPQAGIVASVLNARQVRAVTSKAHSSENS